MFKISFWIAVIIALWFAPDRSHAQESVSCEKTNVAQTGSNRDSMPCLLPEQLGQKLDYSKRHALLFANKNKLTLTDKQKVALKDLNFDLFIDGICHSDCSLILLPLANKVHFTKNSFAVLNTSSANNRLHDLGMAITAEIQKGLSDERYNQIDSSISEKNRDVYDADADLLLTSGKNVSHLTWNATVMQYLKYNDKNKCFPVREANVILTKDYFRENLIDRGSRFVLPPQSVLLSKIEDILGDEAINVYSYNNKPIGDCPVHERTFFP